MQGHNHRRYGDSFERLRAVVSFEDYDYPPFLTMSGTLGMGMFAERLPARDASGALAYSDHRFQHRPASLLPIPMPRPKQHGISPPIKPVDVRWEVEAMVMGVQVRVDSRLLRGDERRRLSGRISLAACSGTFAA